MPAASPLRVLRARSQAATLLHSVRGELIQHLAEPDTAAGLARKLGTSRQRVRYHLRELERAGLIECVAERRNGNCVERLVRATARSFAISSEALGTLGHTPEGAADRFSAAYLMGSASRAVRDVAELDARARDEGKRLATMTWEAEIRFASPEARTVFADELANVLAQLAARYHDDTAPNDRTYRLTAIAHPAAGRTLSARSDAPEPPQAQADGGGDDA